MAGRLGSTGTGVTGLGIAVGEFLPLSARRHPDRACFRFPDGSAHSFALTNARVNRLASALRAEGVRRGDRLAVFALDSHRYMEIVLACMKLGAGTEAGLQTTLTPEDHQRALAERPELLRSCGRPSIGVALRIVDADLRDVPRGEVVRAFVTAATGHRPAPAGGGGAAGALQGPAGELQGAPGVRRARRDARQRQRQDPQARAAPVDPFFRLNMTMTSHSNHARLDP